MLREMRKSKKNKLMLLIDMSVNGLSGIGKIFKSHDSCVKC